MPSISNALFYPVNSQGLPTGRAATDSKALLNGNSSEDRPLLSMRVEPSDNFVQSANGYLDAKEARESVSDRGMSDLFGLTGATIAVLAGGAAVPLGIIGLAYFGYRTAHNVADVVKADKNLAQAEADYREVQTQPGQHDVGFILSDGRFQS